MEMGRTLGSLASSSRSQNQSQCGDRSPSSKATGQQTLAAEEGDKLWRRRWERPAQTQGSFSSRSRNRSQCGLDALVVRGRGKLMRKLVEQQPTPDSLDSSNRSRSLDQ